MEEIFDYAMKMEQDGREYYEKMASETDVPALKKILEGLAEDEIKHYNIFKSLKERNVDRLGELSGQDTQMVTTTKNVFEQMKNEKGEYSFDGNVMEVWRHAQDVEKKSEDFYRDKAKEVNDDQARGLLNKIADEEHKHWAIIENVMHFLNKPKTYLEDAEFSNLEDF